jgi:hypothetical protein
LVKNTNIQITVVQDIRKNKIYHVVCFLLGNSPASKFYVPTFWNTLSVPSSPLPAYEDGTDSVPKHRHIKFRRRGITKKKAYNIQNIAKVLNQENISHKKHNSKKSIQII